MKYLLILFLITTQAFGLEVIPTKKDDLAKFDGYLINPETEIYFRRLDKELEYQTQLATSLDKINKSYVEEVNTMQLRIDNQKKEIDTYRNDNSFFGKYGMFLLGCATATAIAFAVKKASQ